MVRGILGKKVGMTQIFDEDGRVVPVTVVVAGPCVVVQRKSVKADGYEAVQLGLVELNRPLKPNERDEHGWRRRAKGRRRVTLPRLRRFEKIGIPPTRYLAEVPVDVDDAAKPGDSVLADIFTPGDEIKVIGRSKGEGFQGVIRRHNFSGGRATHGSMFHRAPGSSGQSAYPSRVYPGQGMPGQNGNKRVTVKNVKVVKVDAGRHLLFLKGGVPGARNSYVRIVKA